MNNLNCYATLIFFVMSGWSCVAADLVLPADDTGVSVKRLAEKPIVWPEMIEGVDGKNINGPSLIRVPEWVKNPLGKYYLYFAHHSGTYIRLAYADSIVGPWKIYEAGTLHLKDVPSAYGHIASPDVHVDAERKQIRMYFHGPSTKGGGQMSFVATSDDGLSFKALPEVLGIFYFKVILIDGYWYAMAKAGDMYRSKDGLSKFERGANPFPPVPENDRDHNKPGNTRHVALIQRGGTLDVFYSRIGDAPESILRASIDLKTDWREWKATEPKVVLKPTFAWEGSELPLKPSRAGEIKVMENGLRDPAIFVEDGRVYLLYCVAGESGIAVAEVMYGR